MNNKYVKTTVKVIAIIILAVIETIEWAVKNLVAAWKYVKENPWTVVRHGLKVVTIEILGLIALFWLFSWKWSVEDMSSTEKVVSIVYYILMVPLYFGIEATGKWLVSGLANKR